MTIRDLLVREGKPLTTIVTNCKEIPGKLVLGIKKENVNYSDEFTVADDTVKQLLLEIPAGKKVVATFTATTAGAKDPELSNVHEMAEGEKVL